MKFVANHLVAIHNVATAEAMVLAERAGLDPKMVVDMVGPGAGGSRMFQMRAPMMVEGVYEPATMKVSIWKKDMAIIAEFADEVGCATPLFTLTQPVYAEAMAMGLGDQDTAAVFEVLKKTIVTAPKSGRARSEIGRLRYRTASKRARDFRTFPRFPATERSARPSRVRGYHLIIYDFRRINRSTNKNSRRHPVCSVPGRIQ